LGHSIRFFLISHGISIEPASLIASTCIGVLGEYLSHKVHTPSVAFTIPGVIPMIPGTFAFKTMIGVVKVISVAAEDGLPILMTAVQNGIKTGLILAGLAIGIAVPTLLLRKLRSLT
jgi:uncharacterized membrane protein YjjB (DUF3815 family)